MNKLVYDATICPMTKILGLIGGKWKPIILYLIQQDINRFGLLRKSMPRISKKVLTEQLREMEEDNLISRCVLAAKAPQVVIYHLTDKGVSLRNLIDGILTWGKVNLKEAYPSDFPCYPIHQENQQSPAIPPA